MSTDVTKPRGPCPLSHHLSWATLLPSLGLSFPISRMRELDQMTKVPFTSESDDLRGRRRLRVLDASPNIASDLLCDPSANPFLSESVYMSVKRESWNRRLVPALRFGICDWHGPGNQAGWGKNPLGERKPPSQIGTEPGILTWMTICQ